MSLINQALRKAQRDRTPQRMGGTGSGEPLPMATVKAEGMKPGLIIGLVVAVAILLGLVAGLSVMLLKGGDAAPSAQQASAPPAAHKLPIEGNSPKPTSEASTASATTVESLKPILTPPAKPPSALERETTTGVVEDLREARKAAQAKAAAEAKAREEAAAHAAAPANQNIIDWLARAQISGVKLSETESKVILNGKSYSVGEYANFPLGLKVLLIQEKRVFFVDNNGKKYMKRL